MKIRKLFDELMIFLFMFAVVAIIASIIISAIALIIG
jgi:hypothetical protein